LIKKDANIFAQIFGETISKIIASGPGAAIGTNNSTAFSTSSVAAP
jgi:hypothetical protein